MSGKQTLVERLSQIFLVRPHESHIVAYNLGLFVFLGAGLALGRGTADALFFKRYGIEHLPLMYVLSAVALVVSCTLYAAFADRLSSERFFKYILGILSVLLLVAWAMMQVPGSDLVYPFYYVLYEVASELVLIHAGLYLNQNLDSLQSKRLVPLIFGGSQVGIIMGGLMLAVLSPLIGVSNVLLAWVLVSIIGVVMVTYWHRQHGISPFFKAGRKRKLTLFDSLGDAFQGVRFMKHSALLRMASFSLFFMVIMFYVLIYSVNKVYTETFVTEEALSSFFGILVAINSMIALFLQFFVANRILRKFGVKTVNLFFPFTSLFSYLILLFSFTLPSALVGSFNKDVVMTAFRNPVWSLMMNALPGNIQGRARAMTVAVVIPLALMAAGLILMAIKSLDNPIYVALVGLISAALYLHFSRHMNRVYVAEIVSSLKQRLTLSTEEAGVALRGTDGEVMQELKKGIEHSDDQIFLAYARSLVDAFPEEATPIIVKRLPYAQSKVQDQVIRLLLPLQSGQLAAVLWQLIDSADERLQSTCYYGLIVLKDEAVRQALPDLLAHDHARFRRVGILGAYYLDAKDLHETAHHAWRDLLTADDPLSNMFGLELLDEADQMDMQPDMHDLDLKHAMGNLIGNMDVYGCLVSLKVSGHLSAGDEDWLKKQLQELINHENRKVRVASLRACMSLHPVSAVEAIEPALEDAHPEIRELAAKLLNQLAMHSTQAKNDRLTATADGSTRAQSAIMKLLLADNAPKKLMSDLACKKTEEAEQLNEAVQVVGKVAKGSETSSIKVLLLILQERLEGTIDLALQALQGSEDSDAISAIRMGMQSHEPQYRASACEALHGLENQEIGRSLSQIIEAPDQQKQASFKGLEEVVQWCLKRNDPWLYQCANAVQSAST